MKLTLLGAPGAGKGTQSDILSRKLGVPTISTGNILRSAIHDGTSVGLAAKSYIDKGQLVPDNVIIDIVQERLKARLRQRIHPRRHAPDDPSGGSAYRSRH